jgi:hypothetical protein
VRPTVAACAPGPWCGGAFRGGGRRVQRWGKEEAWEWEKRREEGPEVAGPT